MPNNASTKKRVRQDEVRTLRNKDRRSRMRSTARAVREAVAEGNAQAAQAALVEAYRAIDKAAKQHVIHANAAGNKKSNLARLVGTLS